MEENSKYNEVSHDAELIEEFLLDITKLNRLASLDKSSRSKEIKTFFGESIAEKAVEAVQNYLSHDLYLKNCIQNKLSSTSRYRAFLKQEAYCFALGFHLVDPGDTILDEVIVPFDPFKKERRDNP